MHPEVYRAVRANLPEAVVKHWVAQPTFHQELVGVPLDPAFENLPIALARFLGVGFDPQTGVATYGFCCNAAFTALTGNTVDAYVKAYKKDRFPLR